MIISDLPKSFGQLASLDALGNKQVKMISYRDSWKDTQPIQPAAITNNPSDPSFNWTFFDAAIAQATSAGLLASFHISSNGSANQPTWINTGFSSTYTQFIDIAGDSMAVPWGTNYQSAFVAFIQAMGSRYGSHTNLFKWSSCIASTGSDWVMPHTTNANWQNSASFTCPAFNGQVNVATTANSGMSAGQYCFIPGFGWFYAKLNATKINTQLFNPGVSGNASSGTVAANTTIQVNDVANWQNPVYAYTTAKLVNACESTISVARTAFPNSYIQFQVGPSGTLDVFPGGPIHAYNAATQIAQWAYANITNFAMDRDGFDPVIDNPQSALSRQDSSGWYLLAQTLAGSSNTSGTTGLIPLGGTVFGQFNWPCFDPTGEYSSVSTNGYKANGVGNVYVNPMPVFQQTLQMCKYYGVKVIECYEWDVINLLPYAGSFSGNTNAYGNLPGIWSPSQLLTIF